MGGQGSLTYYLPIVIESMMYLILSIWMLFMVSSINSLSPSEKLITSGSSSFPSSPNPQDGFLMSSAKALLSDIQSDLSQSQSQEEGGSLRKRRSVSTSDYKRFSGFKVESDPSLLVDLTEEIFGVSNRLT